MKTISPGSVTGHASAAGLFPADAEFLNKEVGAFLSEATGKATFHYDARAPKGRPY
jgi:homoserine O-acetyltransferase